MSSPSHQTASAYSLGERDGASLAESTHHDTEYVPHQQPAKTLLTITHSERMPLLGHAGPKSASRAKASDAIAIPFPSGPVTGELAATNTIRTLGWKEYVLPDSSYYYHHSALRITTDIDLRNPKKLQVVTEYVEKRLRREGTVPPPEGWELWLKDVGVTKHEVIPVKSWVCHKLRIITSEPPPIVTGEGYMLERFSEDDSESAAASVN